MAILSQENYTIITRHFIYLLYFIMKFIFLIVIAVTIYGFLIVYKASIETEIIQYVFFPIVFLLVNYWCVQLILSLIRYYNKLVIIVRDKFIIIDSSLMFREDLEIMDLAKVMKIDVECHGLLANMFGYGHLIMEQQKDEVRRIHFIPKPFKVWQILRERTSYLGQSWQDTKFFKNR